MILPEDTKNIKEVIEIIYEIPLKKIDWALEPEKFDKWIKQQSITLAFDFSQFV